MGPPPRRPEEQVWSSYHPKLKYVVRLQVPATNNETKYEALLIGLSLARVLEAKTLIIQANSQLVVGQLKGDYEVKEERMQKYLEIVKELL